MAREIIFSEGDFTLYREEGIGMNDTPWEGLKIISDGLAEKHVVEVRLESVGMHSFDGEPVKYKYNPEGTEIAHGMRMTRDTFADTEEYIEVLKSALAFAKRVQNFIIGSEWED